MKKANKELLDEFLNFLFGKVDCLIEKSEVDNVKIDERKLDNIFSQNEFSNKASYDLKQFICYVEIFKLLQENGFLRQRKTHKINSDILNILIVFEFFREQQSMDFEQFIDLMVEDEFYADSSVLRPANFTYFISLYMSVFNSYASEEIHLTELVKVPNSRDDILEVLEYSQHDQLKTFLEFGNKRWLQLKNGYKGVVNAFDYRALIYLLVASLV